MFTGILVDKTDTALNTWYYDGYEWNSGAGPFTNGQVIQLVKVKL